MGNLHKTFGHAGIYAIGNLIARVASFLMLPVYTRYLTPADYGTLELVELSVEVVSIVASAGIINGMSKYYYAYDDERDRNEVVSTIFALILGSYLVACCGGMIFSREISAAVFGSAENGKLVAIALVNLFFSMLVVVPFNFLRTVQKPVLFISASIVKLVLQLGLNILFVVQLQMGVTGVLYSTCISSFLVGAWLSAYMVKSVSFGFSREKARELIGFGAPFIITGFSAFINTFADRFFLNRMCDTTSVGIYSLGYKFGFLLMAFPVSPLFQIWQVQRFEIVRSGEYEEVFNRFFFYFTLITLTVGLLVFLAVKDVLRIMSDSSFWEAGNVVPIILLAYYFQACTDFFNFGIYHSGKSRYMAYSTFFAAVATIVLCYGLIPSMGMYGAAVATLLGFLVRLVYVYIYSQRSYRIRYDLTKPGLVLGACLLSGVSYHVLLRCFPAADMATSVGLSLAGFGLYLGLLFAAGVIKRSDVLKPLRYVYGQIQG